MATLTALPIRLPDDKVPTKEIARDIVATFLPKEWPSADLETLKVTYSTSFTNPNCVVERPTTVSAASVEPHKLFVKFYRPDGADIPAFRNLVPSKQEEALLTYNYGQSGLGARVYGLFQTEDGTIGRIDEFLDARNLEPEDVEHDSIRADLAKSLAAFHSMKMSLPTKPVQLYHDAVAKTLAKYYKSDKLKATAQELGVPIDDLIEYNFVSRLEQILAELTKIQAKTGWCIHDIQSMNILVKNKPKPDESRVTLIDFEFVLQNYRAFDIGGHFMQKLFKWFDNESRIAACRPYTEDEKKHFCDVYAAEWNARTGDGDTGELVYREAELGYMVACAFDLHNMLWFIDEMGDKEPLNLAGLNKLFAEFKGQYEKLGLPEVTQ